MRNERDGRKIQPFAPNPVKLLAEKHLIAVFVISLPKIVIATIVFAG